MEIGEGGTLEKEESLADFSLQFGRTMLMKSLYFKILLCRCPSCFHDTRRRDWADLTPCWYCGLAPGPVGQLISTDVVNNILFNEDED